MKYKVCSNQLSFFLFFTFFLIFSNPQLVQNQSFFFFFQSHSLLQLQTDRHGLQVPKVIPEFENTLVSCCFLHPFLSLLVHLKNDSHCRRDYCCFWLFFHFFIEDFVFYFWSSNGIFPMERTYGSESQPIMPGTIFNCVKPLTRSARTQTM